MRKSKHASILVAALTSALVFSGAAMANDDTKKNPAAERDSSQPVNDTWITTKVKSSLLADSDVSGTDIKVDTVNGVVHLSGHAATQSHIDKAKRIAGGIEGVTKVDTSALKVGASAKN
ncbi:BON domain-containing protein [Xanthomonas sp. XNM01]|uniref:BON domain-containing protein n=1 Tax=Xanthomonas sp. XNM01 TaxID=2769289 RepID=UPI001782039C|nr:BON domain-containing protein [Xanthomonas sp. XNM01]MBD9369687.1 BON domain-containing protein [Xanthomonas sp. XNM01]